MNCPACTYPMTQVPRETRYCFSADIRHERYRCEKCQVTAKVQIVFSMDEPAVVVGIDAHRDGAR